MTTPSPTPQLTDTIAALERALAETSADTMARGLIGDTSGEIAVSIFAQVERLHRLAGVARVDAIAAVERSKVHREHGHVSAHHMARHLGRLASAESTRADKIRRMTVRCDRIDSAWRAGDMSVDQAGVLGRAFANPRSRPAFIEAQDWFLSIAALPFPAFERRVADWVRLHDTDGPKPCPDPSHEKRDLSLTQDHFSQQWNLRASFGALQGAQLRRVLDAYISAENLHDWQTARDQHGDAVCADDLPRTPAQRRADALAQIFEDAATNPNPSTSVDTCHNIVWSQQSFEHALARFLGETPAPVPVDEHRCSDLDGHPLHPDSAFADALVSDWRRVVVSAAGVTVDMSRQQRLYTGLARLGVQINRSHCLWPGCTVPATACQVDHLRPAARGGPTTQANGAPCCQRHNRLKERGYTVTRQPDNTFRITTPTGQTLPG